MRSFNSRIGALVLLVALGSSALIVSGSLTRILELHHSTFNETSWFPVLHNVLINTTSTALVLDHSDPPYEDFTGWTENADASNKLSQNTIRSTFTNIQRDDMNTLLYDTKSLQAFTYYLKFRVDAIDSTTTVNRLNLFTIAEVIQGGDPIRTGNKVGFGILLKSQNSNTDYGINLYETYATTNYVAGVAIPHDLNIGVNYYAKIIKSGTSLTLQLYTDKYFTIEEPDYVGGLSLTLHGNWNLPYIMIPQSISATGTQKVTGYVEYLSTYLEFYKTDGVAYSLDLLGNETDPGAAYSLMANHTQGAGGSLSIEVSSDNSTWSPAIVATSGGVHYSRIEALNYTSLYCRVNLTSLGVTNTVLNDFYFTHLYEVAPLPEPEGLDLMYLLAAVICVGLGALVTQAHKPR